MKKIIMLGIMVALFAAGCQKGGAAPKKELSKEDLKTQMDKISYGIGLDMGKNFKKNEMAINTDLFLKGTNDGLAGKDFLMSDEEFRTVMQEFQQDMMKKMQEGNAKKAAGNREKGKKFLDDNKARPGVKVTESGLQYEVIKEGKGAQPKPEDTVTVHYVGTLTDGTEFDSSIARGEPAKFQLNRVIPGWTEGVGLMNVGAKYRFVIPDNLAYGERQMGDKIMPGSVLVFEVELLGIEKGAAAPAPKPVKK
ncbi:MAG TPA: FKBP-type peptidyl-prolyl cis-trans isomerase [bacterium]|nr:FKBP-type peptidyl-prolyl cis-trans isomerase [bacterium]